MTVKSYMQIQEPCKEDTGSIVPAADLRAVLAAPVWFLPQVLQVCISSILVQLTPSSLPVLGVLPPSVPPSSPPPPPPPAAAPLAPPLEERSPSGSSCTAASCSRLWKAAISSAFCWRTCGMNTTEGQY
jgi:hypothetical protein